MPDVDIETGIVFGDVTNTLFCGGGLRLASIPRAFAVSGVKRSVPSFPLKTVTNPLSCAGVEI